MSTLEQDAAIGVPGLDDVLRGGLRRDRVYLVYGPTGAGKTTFGLQFLNEGVRAGERCLYIGTSETEEEIREMRASHGWPLDGIEVRYHRPSVGASADSDVGQTMLVPAEVELPETMNVLRRLVDELRPQRVVLDSLAEFRILATQRRWYRRQLSFLKELFMERGCTALLVQIPTSDELIESIAHGIFELDQVIHSYGPQRRRMRVVKLRGRAFVSGYHDYRIESGGLRVFPRLVAAEHRRRFTPELMSTGLAQLDAMLGGGLDRGTSTLLVGPSGTGKSTLTVQLALAAAERGERSSIFLFDERPQTLLQRARGLGLGLERHLESGTLALAQIDPAEMSPGEFSDLVRHEIGERDCRLLVLDSLNGYVFAMPEEHYLGVYLHELSSYLDQQAVTSVFVMAERGGLQPASELPVDPSYFSDTVIWFRNFEFHGAVHKAIAVHKRRTGSHEASIRELRFGPGGLEVGPPLERFRGVLTGVPQFVGTTLDERDESTHRTEAE